LSGYPPFYDEDQKKLFKKIKEGRYYFHDEYWSHISPEAVDMIKKMICVNQQKRWTAHQLLSHPWMLKEDESLAIKSLNESIATMKKFNARRRFKAAIETVMFTQRLTRQLSPVLKKSIPTMSAKSIEEGDCIPPYFVNLAEFPNEPENEDDSFDELNMSTKTCSKKDKIINKMMIAEEIEKEEDTDLEKNMIENEDLKMMEQSNKKSDIFELEEEEEEEEEEDKSEFMNSTKSVKSCRINSNRTIQTDDNAITISSDLNLIKQEDIEYEQESQQDKKKEEKRNTIVPQTEVSIF
jgi:serine/threonine protein kinase